MAARGPDFQAKFVSRTPASNSDIARTAAELLQVKAGEKIAASGRVLTESLRGHEGKDRPRVRTRVISSKTSEVGWITEVHLQSVGSTMYFDAAGTPGWTVGVPERPEPLEWRPWRWDWPRPKSFWIDITP